MLNAACAICRSSPRVATCNGEHTSKPRHNFGRGFSNRPLVAAALTAAARPRMRTTRVVERVVVACSARGHRTLFRLLRRPAARQSQLVRRPRELGLEAGWLGCSGSNLHRLQNVCRVACGVCRVACVVCRTHKVNLLTTSTSTCNQSNPSGAR